MDLARAWARERQQGAGVADIARRAGVSPSWVSKLTLPLGPFPRPGTPSAESVATWMVERREGKSATRVARDHDVPVQRVLDATRAHGPFHARLTVDGYLTMSEVADRLGVPVPTICRWVDKGMVLEPETDGTRRLWPVDVFEEWLEAAELDECPTCGARTFDQARHVGAVHRR